MIEFCILSFSEYYIIEDGIISIGEHYSNLPHHKTRKEKKRKLITLTEISFFQKDITIQGSLKPFYNMDSVIRNNMNSIIFTDYLNVDLPQTLNSLLPPTI